LLSTSTKMLVQVLIPPKPRTCHSPWYFGKTQNWRKMCTCQTALWL